MNAWRIPFAAVKILHPIVAKKSKKSSKKNLRKRVEYGLKRLSFKISDHTQGATASEVKGLQREQFPRLTFDFDGSVQSTRGHAGGGVQ
jgi:DNA-binding sugar fermentation-stimulating protein